MLVVVETGEAKMSTGANLTKAISIFQLSTFLNMKKCTLISIHPSFLGVSSDPSSRTKKNKNTLSKRMNTILLINYYKMMAKIEFLSVVTVSTVTSTASRIRLRETPMNSSVNLELILKRMRSRLKRFTTGIRRELKS